MPKKNYLLIVFLMPLLLWGQPVARTITGNINNPAIASLAMESCGKQNCDSVPVSDNVFTPKGSLVNFP